jgi:hypothetical protein
MLVRNRTRVALGVTLLALLGAPPIARAENTKRACVVTSTEGQTLRTRDKLLEARDKLRVCAADPCPSIVKTHCMRWLGELEAQIPSAIVRARDSAGGDIVDADVTIDGKASALGRPEVLDPGEHVARVKVASGVAAEKKFLLVDGDKGRVLTIDLATPGPGQGSAHDAEAPTASSASSAHAGKVPLGAWVLGGAGIVALGASAYFAEVTNDLSGLRKTCAPTCTDAQTSTAHTHALITDVALGVGVAAVAGAVAWAIFGRPDGRETPASAGATVDVRPVAGGAFGMVGLRF